MGDVDEVAEALRREYARIAELSAQNAALRAEVASLRAALDEVTTNRDEWAGRAIKQQAATDAAEARSERLAAALRRASLTLEDFARDGRDALALGGGTTLDPRLVYLTADAALAAARAALEDR